MAGFSLTVGSEINNLDSSFSGSLNAGDKNYGTLIKDGCGTFQLGGTSNPSPAGTQVLDGTLDAASPASLPGYDNANEVSVASGGTLAVCAGTGWNESQIGNLLAANGTNGFATGSMLGLDTTGASSGFTYDDSITGNMGLTKLGKNVLTLTAENSYIGPTVIDAGTVSIASADNIGLDTTATTADQLVINSGGTLQATGSNIEIDCGIAIGPEATIDVAGGATLACGGVIADAPYTSGGSLTKTGDGTLTLSGSNTYSNGTTIVAGTLELAVGGSLASQPVLDGGQYVIDGQQPVISDIEAAADTATTASLSVTASGNAGLIYTWAATGTSPSGVTFSPNGNSAAQDTTATFTQAGTYDFTVTVTDPQGQTTTGDVSSFEVGQQTSSIVVSSDAAATAAGQIAAGGSDQFSAIEYDQFGNVMVPQPTSFTWSAAAVLPSGDPATSVGQVDTNGLYTAPDISVYATITATDNSSLVSGAGRSSLSTERPTVNSIKVDSTTVTPINDQSSGSQTCGGQSSDAQLSGVQQSADESSGDTDSAGIPIVTISDGETTADLSATASDDDGESNLTYSWNYVALSGGATTVSFDQQDNDTTATFDSAGNYRITVTVTDTRNR